MALSVSRLRHLNTESSRWILSIMELNLLNENIRLLSIELQLSDQIQLFHLKRRLFQDSLPVVIDLTKLSGITV